MADSLLVRGAGQVARAGADSKLGATAAAMEAADFISEGTNKVIQARNRHFNSAMKAELERTGEMTDKEYKAYEKKLRRQRFKYVYLNKRGRASLEQDVQKDADNLTKIKDLNDKIANTEIEDPSRDLGGCNADAISKMVSGDMDVVYDENGNPGYNMPTGRECYAAEQEELKEFVSFDNDGNAQLASYKKAWDDGRFELSEDGETKIDKFGNEYPNTKEGYQQFVDASEEWWKKEHGKTKKKRDLDVDTQTGKKSTHAVWEEDNENEFGSPMKMKAMEDTGRDVEEQDVEEEGPKAGKNFMSINAVEDLVKNASVDKDSFKAIEGIVANAAVTAQNIQAGESNEFNYRKHYNNIKQQIVSKGNLRSLAQNTNPFGRVFVEDLAEAIMSSSYEDMGIPSAVKDKGKLESLDPTPKTPINEADAEVIVRSIYNDQKMLGDYVSEYYTNLTEQNFNDNLKPEVAQNFDYKLTFEEAFAAARKRFGPNRKFNYQGVSHSTNTPQDNSKDENEFA